MARRLPVRAALLTVLWLAAGSACLRAEDPRADRAGKEIAALPARVAGWKAVPLPKKAGEVRLDPAQALTAGRLRGVKLDDDPPVSAAPAKPYDRRQTDDCPPDRRPYVAAGIEPFRFRHFTNEFNYGGWHNFAMMDYAAAHGFSVLYPYIRTPEERTNVPKGTRWLKWGGFIDWRKWMGENGIAEGRYDLLRPDDAAAKIAAKDTFKNDPAFDSLMIDMEHGVLDPEQLAKQPWYPAAAPEAERTAFEKRYYDGYAATYIEPVRAARKAGWKDISLYGWQPFGRRWFGLEKAPADPATDWAWNGFGKRIYGAVDILNPSVYCFYWSPQNTAYTLLNIDLNAGMVRNEAVRKPIRPYYWTLLHGGGGGRRWWAGQPLSNEETRAMTAMAFFAGVDGIVLWNWSGTGSHQTPPPVKADADLMAGEAFDAVPEGEADFKPRRIERYDVLHVVAVEGDAVRFGVIDKKTGKPGNAVYAMKKEEFAGRLRPAAEPVSAMIEGLALVKPFEYTLRNGEVKTDLSSRETFAKSTPVVRRVRLGGIHVIAAYDPMCVFDGKPREVVLENFDGCAGLTVRLTADAETRLYVLREQ